RRVERGAPAEEAVVPNRPDVAVRTRAYPEQRGPVERAGLRPRSAVPVQDLIRLDPIRGDVPRQGERVPGSDRIERPKAPQLYLPRDAHRKLDRRPPTPIPVDDKQSMLVIAEVEILAFGPDIL